MRSHGNLTFVFVLVCAAWTWHGSAPQLLAQSPTPLGSYKRIYVAPMPDGMDEFLVAELVKWGKVTVVTDREKADAIMTAGMEGNVVEVESTGSTVVPKETKAKQEHRKGGRSSQSIYDINTGAIRLIDPKIGAVVWAASKSDIWRWWSGGTRTVAQKLAKQFRKDYESSLKSKP